MPDNDQMYGVVIDWGLPKQDFKRQIKKMILNCRENGRVITLPFNLHKGIDFLFRMASILEQVNCDQCDALCCRKDFSPKQQGIPVCPTEQARLERYHPRLKQYDGASYLTTPCSLLDHNRCSAYPDRPFICVIYPIQFGGYFQGQDALALASSCPEARRIAMQFYMMAWRIRASYDCLTQQDWNHIHQHYSD